MLMIMIVMVMIMMKITYHLNPFDLMCTVRTDRYARSSVMAALKKGRVGYMELPWEHLT
jgi:hypothetical protein